MHVNLLFTHSSNIDVRLLINKRPNNIRTMFTQAVAQLYQVIETPYPIYFDQALNCAKLLSRIIPSMIELEENDSKFIFDLLWNKQNKSNSKDGEDDNEPLAVILVNALYHLLFLPEFTIDDPNIDFKVEDINKKEFKRALMWAPGVGSTEKSIVSSTVHDKNRIEVLRVLLSTFSGALYHSPDTYDPCTSMWLEVATSADAPYVELVFYSLVNTVLGYDPIGWGLPYGNVLSQDTAKPLMETSIHLLITLLDYGHPIRLNGTDAATETDNLPYVDECDINSTGFNAFRKYMKGIESPDELNFIYRGFVRLLNNTHESKNVFLPNSVTKIQVEQELLILLWKFLEETPKFMPFILRQCDVTEILVPICYFMLEGRKDFSKVGLIYLCTFMLLKLSGERNFGVALNAQYTSKLPIDVPLFTGNHADLLVISLHKLIVSGIDKFSSLYNCFLTIICNVSPYCKSFCSVSAVKLVNLFQLFTSPRFLYAAESNHIYVQLLLEAFNNIIQYQYEGNYNVIYSIIRRKEIFEQLSALTLPTAKQNAQTVSVEKPKVNKIAKSKSGNDKNVGGYDTDNENAAVPNESSSKNTPMSTKKLREDNTNADSIRESSKNESAAHSAQNSIGKFVPTQSWLDAVKTEFPLNTIVRLLKHLTPPIEEMIQTEDVVDENRIIEYIRRTTMVGLLPVPHPIVIRKYQPNKYTCLWFTAFQWGVVFMHNQDPLCLYDGKRVKLFTVETVDKE